MNKTVFIEDFLNDYKAQLDARGCVWPEEYIEGLHEAEYVALGADNVEKLYDYLHREFWLKYGGVKARAEDWEKLEISGQIRALLGYKRTVLKIHNKFMWITIKRAITGGKLWKVFKKWTRRK